MTAKNNSREITISRIYDYPVKAVWDAWTDPKQVAKWWGPRGFTLTTHSKELKPGGHWHYTMHGPDGRDWINKTKYYEVDTYKRLVYDHGGNDEQEPLFRVTVLFTDLKGKTKMDMTMMFPTPEHAEQSRKFIKQASGDSTWDRLAEYLEKENSGNEIFVINRSFDASIETMWEMWTSPKHVMGWMAPAGFTGRYINADIRPGGEAFYVMTGNGLEMYGKANYLELKKPNLLVYTQKFVDKDGNVSRHPLAPTWPETMKTTVLLTSEGPERTRVTIRWEVVGDYTKAELDTFIAGRAGMTQGWTGSLDKLENYVEQNA